MFIDFNDVSINPIHVAAVQAVSGFNQDDMCTIFMVDGHHFTILEGKESVVSRLSKYSESGQIPRIHCA